MIHPIFRLVATQPQLLADHAQAYAGLVGEEIGKTASSLKTRVLAGIVALALVGVSAVLAGVALMLWAVIPAANIQAPWALLAAPAVPLAVAVACGVASAQKPKSAFAELKQQLEADLAMIREASAA